MINEQQEINLRWEVSTLPTAEPVTLSELKAFARIDGNYEDTLLTSMLMAVRGSIELYLGKRLITQTITVQLDNWPDDGFVHLPVGPIQSITRVATVSESDVETEYSSENYYVDTLFKRLIIKQGHAVPINSNRSYSGFKIVYSAGYGDSGDDVPEMIKQGILLWATSFFENRTFDPKNPPPQTKAMISVYKENFF